MTKDLSIDPFFANMKIADLKDFLYDLEPDIKIPSNIRSTPLKMLATERLRARERGLETRRASTPGTYFFLLPDRIAGGDRW